MYFLLLNSENKKKFGPKTSACNNLEHSLTIDGCSVNIGTQNGMHLIIVVPSLKLTGDFYKMKITIFKSNQIKSLLLSHHHSTSALVSEIITSVLQTVQKNNNLHMDSTYLQTVQKTMCKIHIHILSTHSVL